MIIIHFPEEKLVRIEVKDEWFPRVKQDLVLPKTFLSYATIFMGLASIEIFIEDCGFDKKEQSFHFCHSFPRMLMS